MTPDDASTEEDDLASILAACDEALADGDLPPLALDSGLTPDQARLAQGLECVRLLRDVWKPERSSAQRPNSPPERLGRFQILKELGRGGFGIVYLAFDPRLARPVALKVPRPDLKLTEHLLERFRNEAKAAAGLDHPNIVAVFDSGEIDGVAYIAAAYCPGVSLSQWLHARTDAVPVREAASLLAALADGVAHAHERNVLHRDLKPANVLLREDRGQRTEDRGQRTQDRLEEDRRSPSGESGWLLSSVLCPLSPRITDFGLAKNLLAGADADLTATGAILGTPNYLAPEQADPRAKALGPAVDVYGLGTILYELLTRRPPVESDSVLETLRLVRTEDPIPPRKLRSQVPVDLETICLKCLEKDPDRRYASATDLAADLRRFLAGEPILARPLSALGRAGRWCRRHPSLAALLVVSVLAVLAIGGSVVGLVYNTKLGDANSRLEGANGDLGVALGHRDAALVEAAGQRAKAEDALERLDHAAYLLRLAQSDQARRVFDFRAARRLLGECPPVRRGWEWRYLWNQSQDAAVEFRVIATQVTSLALSPDGRRVAVGTRDQRTGRVVLADSITGKVLHQLRHDTFVAAVAFEPNGTGLAAGCRDGTVHIWDFPKDAAPVRRHVLRGLPSYVGALAFSPDGTRLVASCGADAGRVWDPVAGREVCDLRWPDAGGSFFRHVAFAPHGKTVAAAGDGRPHRVGMWSAETGDFVRIVDSQPRDDTAPWTRSAVAYRPGTGELATALGPFVVRIVSAAGEPRVTLPTIRADARNLAFSPDGDLLAVSREDGVLYIHDADTGAVLAAWPRHNGPVVGAAFGPGGRIASLGDDGAVVIAAARPTRPPLRVLPEGKQPSELVVRPDGREIALGCDDSTIRFLDPATGAVTNRWERPAEARERLPGSPLIAYNPAAPEMAIRWHTSRAVEVWSDGQRKWSADTGKHTQALAYRPDGRQLATISSDSVRLWDPAAGTLVGTVPLAFPKRAPADIAYHPGGRHLFGIHSGEGEHLWSLDLAEGGPPRSLGVWGDRATFRRVVFAPDGGVFGRPDYQLASYPPAGGRPKLAGIDRVGFCWATHPDGRRLAVTRGFRTIAIWDLATKSELLSLSLGGADLQHLIFDPTGRYLIALDRFGVVWIWDAPTGPAA